MPAPPMWAQDLMLDALVWLEERDNPKPQPLRKRFEVPDLKWRRSKIKIYTTGCADLIGNIIVVTAGRRRWEHKWVLLHELAHIVTGEKHTPAFWNMAWELFQWAKLPIRSVLQREYPSGRTAYARRRKS